jgi:hypothetical protein
MKVLAAVSCVYVAKTLMDALNPSLRTARHDEGDRRHDKHPDEGDLGHHRALYSILLKRKAIRKPIVVTIPTRWP